MICIYCMFDEAVGGEVLCERCLQMEDAQELDRMGSEYYEYVFEEALRKHG